MLQELILKEDVRAVFQPVLNLKTRETLGFEGLTRGPQGTEYESPYMLFDIATESDLVFRAQSSLSSQRHLVRAS